MPRRSDASADGLVSQTIASLVNGVSQQPQELRLTSQNETQINCLSDVVKGVSRRPPFEHLSNFISIPDADGYYYHLINRDDTEQYLLTIENGTLDVYDLAGVQQTITLPGDMSYFNSLNPRDDFVAITVADNTFIINKSVTVAMSGNTGSLRPNEFMWWINGVSVDGQWFNLNVNGTNHRVNDGAGVLDSELVTTNMYNALVAGATASPNHGGTGSWTYTRVGQHGIYGEQTHNTGSPEVAQAGGGSERDNVSFLTKKVGDEDKELQAQLFADLPFMGKDGIVARVRGSDESDFDEFYVVADEQSQVWNETTAVGLDNDFDATTMPYLLERTPGGPNDFELKVGSWDSRGSGDIDTSPEPTFVGRTIRDIVLHKNRLILLSDENCVASEASSFFNFWPTTATTSVDSDPIDTASTSNRVTLLEYAIPFQGTLTVVAPGGNYQGEFTGGELNSELTPKKGRIQERGAFAAARNIRPVAIDSAIFLPIDRVTSTGFHEYTLDNEVAVTDENTSHVPSFIPGNVWHLAAQPSDGILVALSDDQQNRLYVYRWFNQGGQRIMSSWSYWETGTGDIIRFAGFILSTMYVVIERGDGLHLEKLDIRQLTDAGLTYRVHLDDLVFVTGTYDSPSDTTTWALPYDQTETGGSYQVIRSGASWPANVRGAPISNTVDSVANEITVSGDFSTDACAIGRIYESQLRLSKIHIKERTETGTKPITTGRLQLRRGVALLSDTGTLCVEVTADGDSETYSYQFTGAITGLVETGPITPIDAFFGFDIGGENVQVDIDFKSDSFLPFNLSGIEWEGYWFQRAGRV